MRKGFTLVELLVVVGIIAVLAGVLMLILNPIELLRQSRDASRIADIGTLDKAISLYYSSALENPSTLFMGTSSVVYVSIPDPSATSTAGDQCQGLGLPSLPTGSTYQCAASSTYTNIDGTGWIPIDFKNYDAGSVISSLPIDPINTTSTNLYYTYETDGVGGFKLTAFFESQKDAPLMANDGGNDPALYEKGTNLTLASNRGLVAYWPFNEGTGSTIHDQSGNGSNGVFVGNPIWTSGTTILPAAVEIPSTGNNISFHTPSSTLPTSTITVALWENTASPLQDYPNYLDNNWITTGRTTSTPGAWDMFSTASGTFAWAILGPGQSTQNKAHCFNAIIPNTWQYLVGTYDGTTMNAYVDGSLCGTFSLSGQSLWTGSYLTDADPYPYEETDLRIYNRALSAAEIQEMYYAEK